ncbi:MAG TPA: sugar ABC transporter permease [Firmicutes bacterium]|nr:sugar ABC transporter permease [Bacillota bacterium]
MSETNRYQRRKRLGNIGYWVVVALIIIPFLFPLLWMLLSSFKIQSDITRIPPVWQFTPTTQHYRAVFEEHDFGRYIFNSAVIALGSTFFSLILGLPAAYSIARFKQTKFSLGILVARIAPGITFLIPWFMIFSRLRMVDTYTSMILAHMLVGLPFIVWVMTPFFEGLPIELEQAAMIDGSSQAGAFFRVLLPLTGPGVITSSILAFVFSWNNFMFGVVLTGAKTKTLPVAVFNFMAYSEINWGGLMAAAVVITAPVIIIALVAQKYIVRGLTAGAVKG